MYQLNQGKCYSAKPVNGFFLAHDLKTPLTSIIGYLTLLEDEPDIQK